MRSYEGWGLRGVDDGGGQFAGLVDSELIVAVSPRVLTVVVLVGLTALSRNSFCSLDRGRRRFVEDSEFKEAGSGSVAGEAADVVIDAWRGRWWYPMRLGARNSRTGNCRWIAGL